MMSPMDPRRTPLALVLGSLCMGVLAPTVARAGLPQEDRAMTGHYLEVRSCDVYTGYCFANSEMGLAGKEAMMVWSVDKGAWDGVELDGLRVIAVVRAEQTLGDLRYEPRAGRAVMITDDRATSLQREALVSFVRAMAGTLVADIEAVKVAPISANLGSCDRSGCASVTAPGLVEISTRCLSAEDHVCGNEETYYPPLTKIEQAVPAFSDLAAYRGDGLDVTWEGRGQRNVFLGRFAR